MQESEKAQTELDNIAHKRGEAEQKVLPTLFAITETTARKVQNVTC